MSDDLLKSLIPALDIAAFERRDDGSFGSIAPVPPWFTRLASDPAFPFLGHILEEANRFWLAGRPGVYEWGPVAEMNEAGAEFHYKVAAVTTAEGRFLIFQLDRASDQIRRVLQTVRTRQLEAEQTGDESAARQAERRAIRIAADHLQEALGRVRKLGSEVTSHRAVAELSASSEAFLNAVRAAERPAGQSRS
jgi:hypothetical protein